MWGALTRMWWVGLVGWSDYGGRLQDKNLERKVWPRWRDWEMCTCGTWQLQALEQEQQPWWKFWSHLGVALTLKGPRFYLFMLGIEPCSWMQMRTRGFLISLWGPGHRTGGWVLYQLRRWCDPRSTNSWISLSPAPPFFTFCWVALSMRGGKKCSF